MSTHNIVPVPLTADNFTHFGDVIECDPSTRISINSARFDRYLNLANIDTAAEGGYPNISIFDCQVATTLPCRIDLLERHRLGSQAFMPLAKFEFIVVVAPQGDGVAVNELQAFITNGTQGLNLHRGVWHIPLIALEAGQKFLVIDRGSAGDCDEVRLHDSVTLVEPVP